MLTILNPEGRARGPFRAEKHQELDTAVIQGVHVSFVACLNFGGWLSLATHENRSHFSKTFLWLGFARLVVDRRGHVWRGTRGGGL